MADRLNKDLGIEAKLVEGATGEFTVWVDGERVAKKGLIRFPSDEKVVTAVRAAL